MRSRMNFDRLAPYYRAMEWLSAGTTLQHARTCHFDRLGSARRILILGEGVGRSLEALVPHLSHAGIVVVEASAAMIAVARRRLTRKGIPVSRIDWQHADVRTWASTARPFDAVITPFVLDCFTPADVEAIVPRITGLLSTPAVWLHADFQIPARGWRRHRARLIHALMYRVFRTLVRLEGRAVTPLAPLLQRAGFHLDAHAERCAGLVCSEAWSRDVAPTLIRSANPPEASRSVATAFVGAPAS